MEYIRFCNLTGRVWSTIEYNRKQHLVEQSFQMKDIEIVDNFR